MSTKEDFVVGTEVTVASRDRFSQLCAYGFGGVVKLVHPDAGVCVALRLARIYQPCFWFSWSKLALGPTEQGWPDPVRIQTGLSGRRSDIPQVPITEGCLRAWLWTKVMPSPGHQLESLITVMPFSQLLNMYADGTDARFTVWSIENDMRPRRPRIIQRAVADGFDSTIGVRRVR